MWIGQRGQFFKIILKSGWGGTPSCSKYSKKCFLHQKSVENGPFPGMFFLQYPFLKSFCPLVPSFCQWCCNSHVKWWNIKSVILYIIFKDNWLFIRQEIIQIGSHIEVKLSNNPSSNSNNLHNNFFWSTMTDPWCSYLVAAIFT